ncbi:MAG: hypothetical protein AAFP82_17935 [Bacteroidota bacterium]
MTRLSSNWTLFYKFFLPTFWIVLLGACIIATWAMKITLFPGVSPFIFGSILTAIYILVVLLLYIFTMRLKRVEIDENYVYITNYFKNYRYPHQDIDFIENPDRPFFSVSTLQLKAAGSLGSKIKYLAVRGWLQDFLRKHPEINILVK